MAIKFDSFKGTTVLLGRKCVVEFDGGAGKFSVWASGAEPLTDEDAADIITHLESLSAILPTPAPKPAASAKPQLAAVPTPVVTKPSVSPPPATKPTAAPKAPAATPTPAQKPTNGAAKPVAAAAPKVAPVPATKPTPVAAAKPAVSAKPRPPAPTQIIEESVGDDEEEVVEAAPAEDENEEQSAGGAIDVADLTDEQLGELQQISGIRDVVRKMFEMGWQSKEELVALCEKYKDSIEAVTRVIDIEERVQRVLTVIQMSE